MGCAELACRRCPGTALVSSTVHIHATLITKNAGGPSSTQHEAQGTVHPLLDRPAASENLLAVTFPKVGQAPIQPHSHRTGPCAPPPLKVYLILLVLWKNGSGFGACTPINTKLCRSVRGWPSGPQEKKRSTKRSRSHSLVPTSAFVSIRDIRSTRFSTAPDLSPTKSGGTQ